MKIFKLIISSDSDGDYQLILPMLYLGNHFTLELSDDTLELEARFYIDTLSHFSRKLHDIFSNIKFISNNVWLNEKFKQENDKLLEQLYDGIVMSPDNFMSGNQDLMITFFEIKEETI